MIPSDGRGGEEDRRVDVGVRREDARRLPQRVLRIQRAAQLLGRRPGKVGTINCTAQNISVTMTYVTTYNYNTESSLMLTRTSSDSSSKLLKWEADKNG